MWAVKNSQKRRSARSEGEKSAGVAAWRAGGAGSPGRSAGTRSGNMGAECTPIIMVHKGRYVAFKFQYLQHNHAIETAKGEHKCLEHRRSRKLED